MVRLNGRDMRTKLNELLKLTEPEKNLEGYSDEGKERESKDS